MPDDFHFAFKVTDEIMIKSFPNLPRFGIRAGKANEQFLNSDLFASAFINPCEPFLAKVGLLMFEFLRCRARNYEYGPDFVRDLDTLLGKLPKGWPYGNRNAGGEA